ALPAALRVDRAPLVRRHRRHAVLRRVSLHRPDVPPEPVARRVVLRPPAATRLPVALTLALGLRARALAVAGPRVGLEPLAAHPTRPLLRHGSLTGAEVTRSSSGRSHRRARRHRPLAGSS